MFTDILHSVLGVPSECVHNSIVRSCMLSFSCWIQGGRHVKGCGDNKWLFSCCVSESELTTALEPIGAYTNLMKSNYFESEPPRYPITKLKPKVVPTIRPNMLRRRIDDDSVII